MTRRTAPACWNGGAWLFLLVLIAIAVAVPLLNLMLPPSSPFHVPTYLVALFGKYLSYALLALSIDLIWGYAGILSPRSRRLLRARRLRHGHVPDAADRHPRRLRQSGPARLHGVPELAGTARCTGMASTISGTPPSWSCWCRALLAFVFGWFAFRSRVTGVYLSIITQALTFALMLGFFRNNFGFGGNNGLTDFKDILGFNVQAQGTRAALFVASCARAVLGFLICRALVTSKFGKVLVAIRDAEARTRFLGYRVEAYKLFVFVLSACMAGVAGALYVPQVGIINPSEFSPGQLHRGGDLGRGRRPRHADRRGDRRRPRQLCQDLLHQRLARALLAVRARRAVRRGDAAAAARHRRHLPALVGHGAARRRGQPRPGRRDRPTRRRGRRSDRWTSHHHRAALSRRRDRLVRRLPRAQQPVASRSSPARCAPSSDRTAPARPR